MNPFKNPLSALWIVFALALVAESLHVAARRRRLPVDPGDQVKQLVDQLEAKGVRLHVTPASASGDPRQGIYLCTAPLRRERLESLQHTPEAVSAWQGAVFVGRYYAVHEEQLLGDSTAVIASCRLFGDPKMVASLSQALAEK